MIFCPDGTLQSIMGMQCKPYSLFYAQATGKYFMETGVRPENCFFLLFLQMLFQLQINLHTLYVVVWCLQKYTTCYK